MGYFANGTEGDEYYEKYCKNCIHDYPFCAVWMAHLEYNYDKAHDTQLVLHDLIPRDENGINQKCNMFIPKTLTYVVNRD